MKHALEEKEYHRSIRVQDVVMLKEELENRKEEIRILEESLAEWKEKYYEMLEHLIELKGKINDK